MPGPALLEWFGLIIDLRGVRRSLIFIAVVFIIALMVLNSRWFLRKMYPLYHRETIGKYAVAYEVDPFLVVAVIRAESGFRSSAASHKGALGLMQIMPDTGRWIADNLGIEGFAERMLYEPETNIRMGTWYLNSLHREFNGSLPVVLAAYNAGRGRVSSWLEDGTWDGSLESLDDIPYLETRVYVMRVSRIYALYHHIYSSRWPGWSKPVEPGRPSASTEY